MKRASLAVLILACILNQSVFSEESGTMKMKLVVNDKVIGKVDDRLFGQFMEKAGVGEPGPEHIFIPGTEQFQPKAVELLKAMKIPVIRFPAGTTIDYIDWRDAVNNVPGRGKDRRNSVDHQGKEMTNKFGYDDYFKIRDELKCETILVLNLLDGLSRKVPLEEAVTNATGLVAYANAPIGAKLPEGMPDWPSVRKANGHPEPYKAEYIQIGNEWWIGRFTDAVKAGTGLKSQQELATWYIECLKKYLEKIRAIDPSVKIIIDGKLGLGSAVEGAVFGDPYIKKNVDFLTYHTYAPGKMDDIKLDGAPYGKITSEELWKNWVSMPGHFSDKGENIGFDDEIIVATSLGYRVVSTEWNWNGWGLKNIVPKPEITHFLAAQLGAAGFLHGLMRQGNDIDLATQSMLIGSGWGIASIRLDREGKKDACYNPQGQATMFYSNHHGNKLHDISISGNQTYEQPYQNSWSPPKKKVAYADMLVTSTPDKIFIHIINRSFKDKLVLDIDSSALGKLADEAVQYSLEGEMDYDYSSFTTISRITETKIPVKDGKLAVELVRGRISIVEIERKK